MEPITGSLAEPDEGDTRASISHVLAPESPSKSPPHTETPKRELNTKSPQRQEPLAKTKRNENNGDAPSQDDPPESTPRYTATTTTTRRNANGSVSSVYSGNRMRYLKKADGEPFWRKDIQFNFLQCVFEDDKKVFTKASDGTKGHTFADIYIDAMAKSSKCSQILKEKLSSDRLSAVHMAMICLLVNVGRMNTTLNFFPEMRARVRTYHSIPALQANQGTNAYKQLQDGPRLKSILKGATEDSVQPTTVDAIMQQSKPRTNPVNLTFVLAQYAPRISETHFFPPRDFFDLFMRSTLSSKSRANAFLWLIWYYLESDFTEVDTQNNPYGKGLPGEHGGLPNKVPALETLTEEEAEAENEDTEEEIAYGEAKKKEREAIVANDITPSTGGPKRGQKSALIELDRRYKESPYTTGSESGGSRRGSPTPSRLEGRGSTSPPPAYGGFQAVNSSARISSLLNEETPKGQHSEDDPKYSGPGSRKGIGRGNWPRNKPKRVEAVPQESTSSQQASLYPNTPSQGIQIAPHYFSPSEERNRNIEPKTAPVSSTEIGATQRSYTYQPTTGSNDPMNFGAGSSRRRPLTQYQQAIERNRRERVKYLLKRRMMSVRYEKRRERRRRGTIVDAWIRSKTLPDGWDSDVDDQRGRMGGLDSWIHPFDEIEYDDVGERAEAFAKAWRSVGRALDDFKAVKPVRKASRDEAAQDINADLRDSSYPATAAAIEHLTRRGSGSHQGLGQNPPSTTSGTFKDAQAPRASTANKVKRSYTRRKPRGDSGAAEDGVKVDGRKKRKISKGAGKASGLGDVGVPMDEFLHGRGSGAGAGDDAEETSSRLDDGGGYDSARDGDNDGDADDGADVDVDDGDDDTVADDSMDVDRADDYPPMPAPAHTNIREAERIAETTEAEPSRSNVVDVAMTDA